MTNVLDDFYRKYDLFAKLVCNCDAYEIHKKENLQVVINLLKAFIVVIENGLYNEIDKATVHNIFYTTLQIEMLVHYYYSKYSLELRDTLMELADLKYDIDREIVRKK